jgi:TrmH family RNA methyltransferase
VPVVQAATADALDWMVGHDYAIWAAAADGEPVAHVERPARVALVAGNEGAGVSDQVSGRAGRRVPVPLRGRADSLNVAIATGILLYMLTANST